MFYDRKPDRIDNMRHTVWFSGYKEDFCPDFIEIWSYLWSRARQDLLLQVFDFNIMKCWPLLTSSYISTHILLLIIIIIIIIIIISVYAIV